MEQKQIIVILADISGYTRFMIENRTSALHGQLIINGLIESILKEVDIPLTLQEIEGDAVFLYAAHPGNDAAWGEVVEQVSSKLAKFFDAFIAQAATMTELTPCKCAVCSHADQLGLKIVVHSGDAVFHAIAGRPQVSGPDVILAHRLLKNSVTSDEYLLLTEAAYASMGPHLAGAYERLEETYDGFGAVSCRVRVLDDEQLAARDAVYAMSRSELNHAARAYLEGSRGNAVRQAAMQQLRNPTRRFAWTEKALMIWDAFVMPAFSRRAPLVNSVTERGKRRPPSRVVDSSEKSTTEAR